LVPTNDGPTVPASAAPARPGTTLVLGVLGGIGSGKSRVARLLAGSEDRIVDADALAHAVLATPEVAGLVRERFGEDVLDAAGLPDREALAARVFGPQADPDDRLALEGWIHPRVRARILERLREARAAAVPVIVLDVPLLLENDASHGLVRECDALVFVDADEGDREGRVRTRGWSPGEIARREAHQLPLAEKRRRADHVIHNQGTLDDLERHVRELRTQLALD
jgi:dephospho-CoA kinase